MGIRGKYNMLLLNITSVVETLVITKTSVLIGINKQLLFLIYFLGLEPIQLSSPGGSHIHMHRLSVSIRLIGVPQDTLF